MLIANNLRTKVSTIYLRTYHITCLFINISFYLAFYTQNENSYKTITTIYQILILNSKIPKNIFTLHFSVGLINGSFYFMPNILRFGLLLHWIGEENIKWIVREYQSSLILFTQNIHISRYLPLKHHLPVTFAKINMDATRITNKTNTTTPMIAPIPSSKPENKIIICLYQAVIIIILNKLPFTLFMEDSFYVGL